MNTLEAFARREANRGKASMVFDWDEAARRIKAAGATRASAGLRDDWEWTGGAILEGGEPVNEYTYLASTWAVPELRIGDGAPEPCYTSAEGSEWDSGTKWPATALAILNG